MIDLVRAEWNKAVGNRLLMAFLVWIYPVGFATFFVLATFLALVSGSAAYAMAGTSSGKWTTDVIGVWSLILAFPNNVVGRLLPLAFMSVMFAGEYEWGTWRFILPRTRREPIILAKAGTSTAIVLLSLVVSSLVIGLGQTVTHRVVGASYGPHLVEGMLLDFARAYLWHMLIGTLALLILAGFATIGGLLTRSILGALLAGLGLAVLEPMSRVILIVVSRILNRPSITNLYQFAATYHLDNARSWVLAGRALPEPIPGFTAEWSLTGSLFVLAIWAIGLLVMSIIIFRRQDITTLAGIDREIISCCSRSRMRDENHVWVYPWPLSSMLLAVILPVISVAAGFQSVVYRDYGASGFLNIQGIISFRDGHIPVGVGNLVDLGSEYERLIILEYYYSSIT